MEKKEIDIQLKKLDDEFHVSNLHQLTTTADGVIESDLTAWDYLWAMAFGFAGIFISNNEKLDIFLQGVFAFFFGYFSFFQLKALILQITAIATLLS